MECEAEVKFRPCRTCLVDLPQFLCDLLLDGNVKCQDVIVQLSWNGGVTTFCGWSGEQSHGDRLNIDPSFAESVNLKEGSEISLKIITSDYPIVTELELEPETFQDWDMIEASPAYIEDSLVGQTRCVGLNQPTLFFLPQNCVARFIVKRVSPPLPKSVGFAYLDSRCEILIAPKVLKRSQNSRKSSISSKKSSSHKIPTRQAPSVLLRAISDSSDFDHKQSYEILISASSISCLGPIPEFVQVSVLAGPGAPMRSSVSDKDPKPMAVLQVVARLVVCDKLPSSNARLSPLLSVALGLENTVGNLIRVSPSRPALMDTPSSLVVRRFKIESPTLGVALDPETEKAGRYQQNLNLCNSLATVFNKWNLVSSCLTNGVILPRIPNVLSYGGLLEFKDTNGGWMAPLSLKQLNVELGDDVLVEESKTPKNKRHQEHDTTVAQEELLASISKRLTMTQCNTGILLSGASGVGKTSIISETCSSLTRNSAYSFEVIQCETLANESPQTIIGNTLQSACKKCYWKAPSVLVLENLHSICPMESETTDSTASRCISEYLVTQLDKLTSSTNCAVIITCTSKNALNPLFLTSSAIQYEFHMKSPPKDQRSTYLSFFLNSSLEKDGFPPLKNLEDNEIFSNTAMATEGYLPMDLKTLTERAYHNVLCAYYQSGLKSLVVRWEHFEESLKDYVPTSLRGVKMQKSQTSWDDIGGLHMAKSILLETLEWPVKFAPIFANCPLRLRSGILLYGYPGCGKTLLASAVASQCGLNFISVKGPELLNKYIGASEQSVRELFERASSAKPCILFFDEFDSIAPKRGHDSTGVTDRVVNQMLTQMDGAEGLDGVYVLAATSRPDLIDSALLRPGRLDKAVLCDMPTSQEVCEIIKCVTRKMSVDKSVRLESVVDQCVGFNGADIQALAYNAYLKAVHERLDEQKEVQSEPTSNQGPEFFQISSKVQSRIEVSKSVSALLKDQNGPQPTSKGKAKTEVVLKQHHFVEALKETKSSISRNELQKLFKIYSEFQNDRSGDMPNGEASSEIGGRTTLM